MALICSSNGSHFGMELVSISMREPTFGHATTPSLHLKARPKTASLTLKSSHISQPIAGGFKSIDDYVSRKPEITRENLMVEEFLNDGLVYQCHFLVRSYESGPDNKMTMFFVINQLQESKLNHFISCGLVERGLGKTGFGTTHEMTKRDLIWVVHKLQVVVDQFPSWNDVVELRTWICKHGKNSYRRNWIARDKKSGKVLIRAICFYVLMNKRTRKLSKFCEELKEEMNPFFLDSHPILEEDNIVSQKLHLHQHDCTHASLVTRLSDLDMNQHINNASYINFVLEGTPRSVLENYQLSGITIKYLKECSVDQQLQSLSVPLENDVVNGTPFIKDKDIKLHHSILSDGIELVRAKTVWTPKFN
ncbi:palmitoyl-acyl carrier protein thioesterase, chloroplastic-like [Cucurbita pepo subsp. pepo]|uniref:palmitoyl-acyl carrier protein thioesterase, chloroplastic-like n=1 Tax=Cucurbita pepo subsp. pepo TaxID=3664 RepID=UPI000C9D5760|nr:palmitoyl-acyl carrier protein thioesterase, chloroplastic-like [Cucurbita pepo subsp. pepo]